MYQHSNQDISFQIVFSVLSKIDAIRFAHDYNQLNNRQKQAWLRERYIQEHEHQLSDMSSQEIDVKLREDQDLVAKWKKAKGDTTTARSRLLDLYLHVSHDSFGLACC